MSPTLKDSRVGPRIRFRLQWLLLPGVALLPFTYLRFGPLGPAEILLLAFAVSAVFAGKVSVPRQLSEFEFSSFWVIFLVLVTLGAANNELFQEYSTGTRDQALFDWVSYCYIAIVIFVLEACVRRNQVDAEALGRRLIFLTVLILAVLFTASRIRDEVLGFPLFYFDRFVPLTENPHQLVTHLLPMGFLGLYFAGQSGRRGARGLFFACSALIFLVVVGTGAAKGVIGIALGLTYFGIATLSDRLGLRTWVPIVSGLSLASVSLIWVDNLSSHLARFFSELDASGERGFLYRSGLEIASESIALGRGPGAHIEMGGQYYDAHQSLLTALLQGGMFAAVLLIAFLAWLLFRLRAAPALFAAVLALSVYFAGGDLLRRLSVWILLLIMVGIVRQIDLGQASQKLR